MSCKYFQLSVENKLTEMEFDNEIGLKEPEYDYMDERFAENLLEIVYSNLEDIMAGKVIRFVSSNF